MPKPGKKHLFNQELENLQLQWGIGPGEHVAHIVTSDMKNMTIISYEEESPESQGYNGVGKEEMYHNAADNKTAKLFMNIAKSIAQNYEQGDNPEADDFSPSKGENASAYKNVLEKMKDYITAGHRSSQQTALSELKKAVEKYNHDVSVELKRQEMFSIDERDVMEAARIKKGSEQIQSYMDQINALTKGSLNHQRDANAPKPTEPSNTVSGSIGVWVSTDQELFPHEPSPNDIKQGYGVENCFMLSAMSVIASKDPDFIKDMMKDNGDGTVTVRFYNGNKPPRNPVYIDVQKTVNKGPVGNNVYSSGSLWVQMLEKAYAKYAEDPDNIPASSEARRQGKEGFSAIDRGVSDNFLKAIHKDQDFFTRISTTQLYGELYECDVNGKEKHPVDRSQGYLKYEDELFSFYDNQVNKKNEIMTVGTADSDVGPGYAQFLKNHGIRTGHAYGILKVFEKKVNGQNKKFVQLRDPYATFTAQYDKNGKMVENAFGGKLAGGATMLGGIAGGGTEEMGTFNLEFTDYLKCFKNFTGISKEAHRALNDVCVKYVRDEKGLSTGKTEFDHRPEYDLEIQQRQEPFLKDLTKEERTIYNALNKDAYKLNESLKKLKNELKVTDEFFTWPNSKEFNKMRDDTYKLSKDLDKAFNTGMRNISLDEKIALTKRFSALNKEAEAYENKKVQDLKNTQKKGKTPSVRFVHRLATAMSIKNLTRGEDKINEWPTKGVESLGIVMNDIQVKIDRVEKGEIQLQSTQELQNMKDMVQIVGEMCKKDPTLQERAHIKDINIQSNTLDKLEVKSEPRQTTKENSGFINDFEDLTGEIDTKKEVESNKKETSKNIASDFDMIDMDEFKTYIKGSNTTQEVKQKKVDNQQKTNAKETTKDVKKTDKEKKEIVDNKKTGGRTASF